MQCAYKFCTREVKQEPGGRQRRYCSDAHKQAAFRQRHPKALQRNEIKALKSRIYRLERFAVKHAPSGYRLDREIAPVSIGDMVRGHGTAERPVTDAIQVGILKPIDGMLNASGQETFYQLFHQLPGWRDCSDCPHGVIP